MPAQSRFSIESSARQWLALAERRLSAYMELYESGRWRHYYRSQEEFAARMLDVIRVAKSFRRLAGEPMEADAPAAPESFRTAA